MEMTNFVALLQKIVDEEYPNLRIDVYAKRDDQQNLTNVAIGMIDIASSFAIKKSENYGMELIKARVLNMLYSAQVMINDDIERIKNDETSDKRSNKT